MGCRRIRNLISLKINKQNIYGFDIDLKKKQNAKKKYNINIIKKLNLKKKIFKKKSVFIISTPPNKHLAYLNLAVKKKINFFVEASVIIKGLKKIHNLCKKKKIINYTSSTMNFYYGPQKIFEIIKNKKLGKILYWNYISGQNLNQWHPWENIKDYYVSKKETGGCREIVPFELSWLIRLFGPVKKFFSYKDKISNLDANIDDIYLIKILHKNKILGSLSIDVINQKATRLLYIIGEKKTLVWDDDAHNIKIYETRKKYKLIKLPKTYKNFKKSLNSDDYYKNELKDFLKCIKLNKNNYYNLSNDIKVLELLNSIDQNAKIH